MKIYLSLAAVATSIFLLAGCSGDTTTPDTNIPAPYPETQYPQNDQLQNSAIPPQDIGIGEYYDLASFMYAYPPLNNQGAVKEFMITTQNSDYTFDLSNQQIQRVEEGATDELGDTLVNVYENNTLSEHAVIDETRISVTYYSNGIDTGTEQYRRDFRLHEDMLRNENGACVYQDIFENLDISEIIPRQANPNTGIAQYAKVLHVYCGTADGTKIDRFYADGWGVIAEVILNTDGTARYSVLNQSTYQTY